MPRQRNEGGSTFPAPLILGAIRQTAGTFAPAFLGLAAFAASCWAIARLVHPRQKINRRPPALRPEQTLD